ncbi:MAG: phage DNA packaging protein J [Chthoniobacter sp.]
MSRPDQDPQPTRRIKGKRKGSRNVTVPEASVVFGD